MTDTIFHRISELGVVPVIAIDDASRALALADALLEGGLPVAEITFRTQAAAEAIGAMAQKRPELITGAGTILDAENLKAAKAAGARFGLAPGYDPKITAAAKAAGLPFAPGVMTPSELGAGLGEGLKLFKFFPAKAAGGRELLSAIDAPFAHLSPRFVPTGGVTLDTMRDWLSLPAVAAVGGTWIATREDIAAGDFAAISRKAREAVERAKQIREERK